MIYDMLSSKRKYQPWGNLRNRRVRTREPSDRGRQGNQSARTQSSFITQTRVVPILAMAMPQNLKIHLNISKLRKQKSRIPLNKRKLHYMTFTIKKLIRRKSCGKKCDLIVLFGITWQLYLHYSYQLYCVYSEKLLIIVWN